MHLKTTTLIILVLVLCLPLSGCSSDDEEAFVHSLEGEIPEEILTEARDIFSELRAWFGYSLSKPLSVESGVIHRSYVHFNVKENTLIIDDDAWLFHSDLIRLELMRELIQAFAWRTDLHEETGSGEFSDFLSAGLAAYIFHERLFQEPFQQRTLSQTLRRQWFASSTDTWSSYIHRMYTDPIFSKNRLLLPLSVVYYIMERFGTARLVTLLRTIPQEGHQQAFRKVLGMSTSELEASWRQYFGLL